MCSLSCGLCRSTNENESFNPELIDLFDAFFGSLPGSHKPEAINFNPKSASRAEPEMKSDVIEDAHVTIIESDEDAGDLGSKNKMFGISQKRMKLFLTSTLF